MKPLDMRRQMLCQNIVAIDEGARNFPGGTIENTPARADDERPCKRTGGWQRHDELG
jgi:hypothetical protein